MSLTSTLPEPSLRNYQQHKGSIGNRFQTLTVIIRQSTSPAHSLLHIDPDFAYNKIENQIKGSVALQSK